MKARLRRLEQRLAPPAPVVIIQQWCDQEGRPCDPPGEVMRAVEQQACGRWRVAAWADDAGIVVLLGEGEELQVVEL